MFSEIYPGLDSFALWTRTNATCDVDTRQQHVVDSPALVLTVFLHVAFTFVHLQT